jgi:hypothetical protein
MLSSIFPKTMHEETAKVNELTLSVDPEAIPGLQLQVLYYSKHPLGGFLTCILNIWDAIAPRARRKYTYDFRLISGGDFYERRD